MGIRVTQKWETETSKLLAKSWNLRSEAIRRLNNIIDRKENAIIFLHAINYKENWINLFSLSNYQFKTLDHCLRHWRLNSILCEVWIHITSKVIAIKSKFNSIKRAVYNSTLVRDGRRSPYFFYYFTLKSIDKKYITN